MDAVLIARLALVSPIAVALAGCNQRRSTLTTFGAEAGGVRAITLILVAGAAAIAGIVAAPALRATRAPEGALTQAGGMRLVL